MGNVQYAHMGGGLDVTDLMSQNPPPPLKGLMPKQETKVGGLRTGVAPALRLVAFVDTSNGVANQWRSGLLRK